MKIPIPLTWLLLAIAVLCLTSCCPTPITSIAHCLAEPYSSPPTAFRDADLVGGWQVQYMEWGVDRLVFREDGTFKQSYQDLTQRYAYDSRWKEWWVERFRDGRVRVHLQGARYFADGIILGELDGMGLPCPQDQPNCWQSSEIAPYPFYDPVLHDTVHMVGELALNVRIDRSGQLLLLHMWPGADESFGIFACQSAQFRRSAGQ